MSKPRDTATQDLRLGLRHFIAELLASSVTATELHGLNSTDLAALCLLVIHGPTPAGRLARLTGLTTGAITGVIDRLENSGFVRREPDPADRRRVIVVADAGRVERELFPRFSSLQPLATREFYDRYTVAELALIGDFFARLANAPDVEHA